MASGNYKRPRGERVTGFTLPPGQFARTLENIRRGDVLLRVGLCTLAALVLWLISTGWAPPFGFRRGYIPHRPIITRVKFELDDDTATLEATIARILGKRGAPVQFSIHRSEAGLRDRRDALRRALEA